MIAIRFFAIPALAAATSLQAQLAPPPLSAIDGVPAVAPLPPSPALPTSPAELPRLKLIGSSLYVYNFLDMQAETYSPKVIAEFERQLNEWLGSRVKRSALIRSAETPYMKAAQAREADAWSSSLTGGQLTQRVPVLETIASNHQAEANFGADHRLVIFPASFSSAGAWRYYSVRWVVMRVADGKSWQHVYSGSHMVMLKESERSESRSKKFIAAIDKAMLDAGLFTD